MVSDIAKSVAPLALLKAGKIAIALAIRSLDRSAHPTYYPLK